MTHPVLACCNFLPTAADLKEFAREQGFGGIDWTFTLENLPDSPAAEAEVVRAIAGLAPFEIRYHLAFQGLDLGDEDPDKAQRASGVFRQVVRLISKLRGRFVTIHVGGLGRDSSSDLCWPTALAGLQGLVQFASRLRVRLCVENLAWGWTSRPELFEKLLRFSGAWATLDVGHAQKSPAVASGLYRVKDFVAPYPERFVNAHIYHEENDRGHEPPADLRDLEPRLRLVESLPLCHWWVLELREEEALLKTLRVVREFFELWANGRNS
jgi:sugar phosphate isomerase/epimerase